MGKTSTENKKASDSKKIAAYEKKIYDLTQLLEISKSLCSVLDYSALMESILYICMCQMRVLGAGMFVAKEYASEEFCLFSYHNGLEIDPSVDYTLSLKMPQIKHLCDKAKPLTLAALKKAYPKRPEIEALKSLNPSLIIPLKQKNRLIGILVLGERIDLGDGVEYNKYEIEEASSIASLAAIAINNATLVEMSTTDMMTKLKIKHYFFAMLTDALDMSLLHKLPLAVFMLDIDFFKKFNDTYGHACGDYVLSEVARIISSEIREKDLAGRYGGEEFTVMLYNVSDHVAMMAAERIRSKIEKFDFEFEGVHMTVTISIGVAVLQPDMKITSKELVDQADQALYMSKKNGRNRVTLYSSMKDEK